MSTFSWLGINAKQSGYHSQAPGMMVWDQIAISVLVAIYSTSNIVVGQVVCGVVVWCNKFSMLKTKSWCSLAWSLARQALRTLASLTAALLTCGKMSAEVLNDTKRSLLSNSCIVSSLGNAADLWLERNCRNRSFDRWRWVWWKRGSSCRTLPMSFLAGSRRRIFSSHLQTQITCMKQLHTNKTRCATLIYQCRICRAYASLELGSFQVARFLGKNFRSRLQRELLVQKQMIQNGTWWTIG